MTVNMKWGDTLSSSIKLTKGTRQGGLVVSDVRPPGRVPLVNLVKYVTLPI